MVRMSEKDALKNIVRFSDPRLHRVGFGINLTIFNPKERTVLIYRKGSWSGINPCLSVIPFDELQTLQLSEFCILGNRVVDAVMHILSRNDLGHHLRDCNSELEGEDGDGIWHPVSLYHVISQMNWMIEFLQQSMSQEDVEQLVWGVVMR